MVTLENYQGKKYVKISNTTTTRSKDRPKLEILLKAVFTKPTSLEGLYNAQESDEDRKISRYFLYD